MLGREAKDNIIIIFTQLDLIPKKDRQRVVGEYKEHTHSLLKKLSIEIN
jgi:hypothetical protein